MIGINTAIFSPSGGNVGIAFAIPASTARAVINDLIQSGSVERGWLGVQIQPVTADIAESLGLAEAEGDIRGLESTVDDEKALSAEARALVELLNQQRAALRQQIASLQATLDASEARDTASQAEIANLWAKDTYEMYPADMLMNKAVARMVRFAFPDVLRGYVPDEMTDITGVEFSDDAHLGPVEGIIDAVEVAEILEGEVIDE